MLCPFCGKEHPDTARYCPVTGQPISEQLVCPHCGEPIEEGWNACANCGQLLKAPKEEPHTMISQRSRWLLIGVAILSGVFLVGSFWLLNCNIFPPKETPTVLVIDQDVPTGTLDTTPTSYEVVALTQPSETPSALETITPIRKTLVYTISNFIGTTIAYPHWFNYVRSQLEFQFDAQALFRSGIRVYTTLDPVLQDAAEQIVRNQVSTLSDNHVTNGALVAIRPDTGEILAMVGSADFYNEAITGQINMAVNPTRQPGTAIMPFTYLAAFEKGWTPATLLWDVPTSFPPSGDPYDPAGLTYTPENYDGRFHGPVTVRNALANSYNILAAKALQFAGIYDDPGTPSEDGMISLTKRLGISSLTRQDYGLSLTIGGGEVSLLELTAAYSTLANNGLRALPFAIYRIEDLTGNIVYEHDASPGQHVIRAEHAYLISNILFDNEARAAMFGTNSPLALPYQVAAKTGTTNEFRDNWTLGYTPDLAVGVWVGNTDNTPMVNTNGLTGAAPIWHDFMIYAINQLKGGNPTPFNRPVNIVDRMICTISGTEPSSSCPSQRSEIFVVDQPPLPASQDLWAKVMVDTWTNLKASSVCGDFTAEIDVINVIDPWARIWLTQNDQGRVWAENIGFKSPLVFMPDRECTMSDSRPLITFKSPLDGQTISTSTLDIFAQVDATANFGGYRLEWGEGDNPEKWYLLFESALPVQQPVKLYTWDLLVETEGLPKPDGVITLRLYMQSTLNTHAEKRLYLDLQP